MGAIVPLDGAYSPGGAYSNTVACAYECVCVRGYAYALCVRAAVADALVRVSPGPARDGVVNR